MAVCLIVEEVCSTIVEVLLQRGPTGDSLKEVIHGLNHKWEVPQSASTVDRTHIPIMSPSDFQAGYILQP